MGRKQKDYKRHIQPDPRFKDRVAAKFINNLMYDGKKGLSERLLYDALDAAESETGKPALDVLHEAVEAVKPSVEVRSRRVGGATYQVPVEVRLERQQALAVRWLVLYARQRGERTMSDKLKAEFLDAAAGRGGAFKKKEDIHRMAEANRAFAHYRW